MTSLYDRFILPKLLTCACSSPPMMKQRAKIVPRAQGRVLELGIGMGLNLGLYDAAKVESVTGVDPAPELRAIAEAAPRDPRLKVTVADGTAEALPFEDASFDTVVCTFGLCAIPDHTKALNEMTRVLRPGGQLILVDHIRSSVAPARAVQRFLELFTVPLGGEHFLRRPLNHIRNDPNLDIERVERFKLGLVERLTARKPT